MSNLNSSLSSLSSTVDGCLFTPHGTLTASDDLDDLKETGGWRISSGAVPINAPQSSARGWILVFIVVKTSQIIDMYFTESHFYIRYCYNSNWESWMTVM